MTNDDSNDDLAPEDSISQDSSLAGDASRAGEASSAREFSVAEDDRRCQERRSDTESVRIKVADLEVRGRVENVSEGGLFLVLDRPLQLEVECDREVGVPSRRATLVRCQSLPGGKSGWGIQFELESEDD